MPLAVRTEIVVNWIVYTSVYQKTEELIPRRVDPEKSKAFSPELRNASDGPDWWMDAFWDTKKNKLLSKDWERFWTVIDILFYQ